MISKYGVAFFQKLLIGIFIIVVAVLLGWILPDLKGPVINGEWLGGANPLFMKAFAFLGL